VDAGEGGVNAITCREEGSRRRCRAHAIRSTVVGSGLEEGRGSHCQGRKRRRQIRMELARRLPLLPSVRGVTTRSDPPWRGLPPTDAATGGGEDAVAAHGKQQ
jgi:hypothetical protein